MTKAEEGTKHEAQFKYRTGIVNLLHMIRWLRLDTMNAVRESLHSMMKLNKQHIKVLIIVMKYCLITKTEGISMKPYSK